MIKGVYEPSQIELDKGIRSLSSIGLANISVSIRGDVYNSKLNKYLTGTHSKGQPRFLMGGKSYSLSYLMKIGFKYDKGNPKEILDLKDKVLYRDVVDTWEYHNIKNRFNLIDLKCCKSIVDNTPKNILMDLKATDDGIYNESREKYLPISEKGNIIVSYVAHGKQYQRSLSYNTLLKELKSLTSTVAPSLETFDNPNPNPDPEIIDGDQEEEESEVINTEYANDSFDTDEVQERPKVEVKTVTKVVGSANVDPSSTILGFINDLLTLPMESVSEKYKINTKILQLLK